MRALTSLALGCAVGFVAIDRAAADFPGSAKAVEYVKICSTYGAGFYYMPGTDVCLKFGGVLRAETAFGTNALYNWATLPPAGGHNRLSNFFTTRARQELYVDTRTATEYGVVRAYAYMLFGWTTASVVGGAGAGASTFVGDSIGGSTPGVYAAFIQFAGFTMGRTISQFDAPWTNYPGNNFDGLVGGSSTITGADQFSYTAQLGNGVSLALSAQDSTVTTVAGVQNLTGLSTAGMQGGLNGLNNVGGTRSPDLIAALRVDQAWGLFQASAVAHQNTSAYYSATEISGHPDNKWGWAAQLALSIKNIPTGQGDTINMQAIYTDGATRFNFQNLAPVSYSTYGSTSVAGLYQSIGFANAPDAVYVGTSTANGSQLETITTWGFRGAFTHNWNPNWNTAIYGAYAEVRYGNLGKNAVCAFIATNQPLVVTCNPDFSINQVGIITRWIPVKNLTFSADFNLSRHNQKYAGIWNAAANTLVAKPVGAIYELKGQDSRTLLLRAQRNW